VTIAPGPFYNRMHAILPGNIVSCSNPNLSNGTVIYRPPGDWDSVLPEMVRVDFGDGTGKIWVRSENLTVTG
jgi:hypothetical protein